MSLLIELHYLPCIEYVGLLLKHENVYLEAQEHYEKQTYRNRCKILLSNKIETLSVPVRNHNKCTSGEITIDYSLAWQNTHWRSIASAYGKSPFFEYYEDTLKQILYTPHEHLWSLNMDLLRWLLKSLKANTALHSTTTYEKTAAESLKDLRNSVHPRKISLFYEQKPYQQVFLESEFVPNLSVLDALFCLGPQQTKKLAENSVKIS
jgi:hypothetical protein